MSLYNKKCKGCGNWLSSDKDDLGFIPKLDDTNIFCMRCFKLRNYGKLSKVASNDEINEHLSNFDPELNLVILVVDLFDIKNTLHEPAKDYKNLLIVINRSATLPKKFNKSTTYQNLENMIFGNGFNPIDIVLYDGLKKEKISSINEYILQAYELRKKIYIIGKTNVGKSTLINALLKYNKINQIITTSPFKNTTLNFSKTKIGKTELIDTPGFANDGNILNNLSEKDIKNISKQDSIIKNFQIKDNQQMFFIDKLFGFIVTKDLMDCNVTFYSNSIFKINRSKVKPFEKIINNEQEKLISYVNKKEFITIDNEIDSEKKYNLFVSGIALVSFSGVKKIEIISPKDVNYFLTEHAII